MKPILALFLGTFLVFCSNTSSAQSRGLATGLLQIDDGAGHIISLQPPAGLGSSYSFILPKAPANGVPSGYVAAGDVDGQGLFWNGTYWAPSQLFSFDSDVMGLGVATFSHSLPFPITVGQSVGPVTGGSIDLGDASHPFRTVYVEHLSGITIPQTHWNRGGATLSPDSNGDNITTTGNISVTGSGALLTSHGLQLVGDTSALIVSGSAGTAGQMLVSNGPNATPAWQSVQQGGSAGWGLSGNSASTSDVLGTTNAQDLVIETNGSEAVRIAQSGKVGIGSNAPSEKLEVRNGNVLISNSGTAGQVQLQGSGSGLTTFAAGAQGSSNIHYTLPTAQGSSNTVLTNDGTGALSWAPAGGTLFAMQGSSQDQTSTSMVADTFLVIPLAANATYTFDAFLSFSDPNWAGISYKFMFDTPSGASLKWGYMDAASGLSDAASIFTTNSQSNAITTNRALESYIRATGIVITGSTAGNLQFKMKKNSGGTSTDPLRINQYSYIRATRVK